MKKVLLLAIVATLLSFQSNAQRKYFTSQSEYMLSWSNYTGLSDEGSNRTRFSMFPNYEFVYNMDGAGSFGMYVGMAHRNVGFSWRDSVRHKRRSMSLGIPLVFKIGDLENENFFFFGGEVEFFYHLKKKDWDTDNNKTKVTKWLSDEVNMFQQAAMIGYCTNRVMFKAKYYITDFFNQDYVNANGRTPYATKQSNMFYLSIALRSNIGDNDSETEVEEDENRGEGFDFGSNFIKSELYRDM